MTENEAQKEIRLHKFLDEHPKWTFISDAQANTMVKKEIRLSGRLEKLKELAELRYKNELTLQEIAEKYGVSRQAIQQRLWPKKKSK